jgi:hypothetical protein
MSKIWEIIYFTYPDVENLFLRWVIDVHLYVLQKSEPTFSVDLIADEWAMFIYIKGLSRKPSRSKPTHISKNLKKWNNTRQGSYLVQIGMSSCSRADQIIYSKGGKQTYYWPIIAISMCVIKLAKLKLQLLIYTNEGTHLFYMWLQEHSMKKVKLFRFIL